MKLPQVCAAASARAQGNGARREGGIDDAPARRDGRRAKSSEFSRENEAEVEPHVHKVETTWSELKANAQAQ